MTIFLQGVIESSTVAGVRSLFSIKSVILSEGLPCFHDTRGRVYERSRCIDPLINRCVLHIAVLGVRTHPCQIESVQSNCRGKESGIGIGNRDKYQLTASTVNFLVLILWIGSIARF